ncbi:hypothetical protein SASPL_118321 [Salvia splendens]|uniref:Transposase-associated domain-containing protein n=1 Tax=Salvia splendens TaxID=180675 RepID=A0A8X8XZH7_SALSN|nr:hypothetical protein SASPL_118321 [Salvia splendens]
MKDKILCPCKRCGIGISVSRDEAFEHLTVDGFIPGYTQWIAHGELPSSRSSREAFPDAMVDLPKSYYEAEKLMRVKMTVLCIGGKMKGEPHVTHVIS